MTNPHGIIIFGPNGSGKTTLGRELACTLNFHAMDIEDYYFEKSDIPYTVKRSREECLALMLADIQKHGAFVLSAVTGDFGGEIESLYDLAVWIDAPARLRLQRVKQRSFDQYGERILEGGDMHENHLRFMDFVATRSLSHVGQWAESLCCPIVRIDGALDYKQTAADIAHRFYTKPDEPWRVTIAGYGELKHYRFVVVFARYQDKWLYCRAKERNCFETAGGHIEPGETPLEAAKRELYEETGAARYDIASAFDYAVHRATEFSYGQVFFAQMHELGDIPDYEMAEVKLFDTIPDKMRFPQILPVLFERINAAYGENHP